MRCGPLLSVPGACRQSSREHGDPQRRVWSAAQRLWRGPAVATRHHGGCRNRDASREEGVGCASRAAADSRNFAACAALVDAMDAARVPVLSADVPPPLRSGRGPSFSGIPGTAGDHLSRPGRYRLSAMGL